MISWTAPAFDEPAFFRALASREVRALLIGRRALVAGRYVLAQAGTTHVVNACSSCWRVT